MLLLLLLSLLASIASAAVDYSSTDAATTTTTETPSTTADSLTVLQAAFKVLLAFLPAPSITSVSTFFLLSALLMSTKFRSKAVTYSGVIGVFVWYSFRRMIKRKTTDHKRRETIKMSKSPVKTREKTM